jgi:7-cyano-7-deazaguanine synthase
VPKDGVQPGIPITYVPARNTIFLSLALGWAEAAGARDLFIGVNALDYSGYPDCRPEFIAAFEGWPRSPPRRASRAIPSRSMRRSST